MVESGDRERLAATFDGAADLYQRARPEYPGELVRPPRRGDRAVAACEPAGSGVGVGQGDGCRWLDVGFHITCLEPGTALAAAARSNLAAFDVEVVEASFEDWTPTGGPFDMVYAATAWHWLDPTIRYQKAAALLRRDGYLALWGAGHVIPYDGDPFFEEIQDVYDEIGESLPPDSVLPRPQELEDDRAEIEASGLFDVVDVTQYDWETVYDADGYIEPAEHLLGAHRDAGLAARPALRRGSAPARRAF